jgi:hypothetical protein
MNKYVIINAEAIQKRIEELEKERLLELKDDFYDSLYLGEINALKQILSQSTPLIPEIEKAFDAGQFEGYEEISFDGGENYETVRIIKEKQDYISNLKLDI